MPIVQALTPKFSLVCRSIGWAMIVATCLALAACGSTKVYTADKTVVYGGSIYNVSNVKVFTPKSEADVGQGQTVNLQGMDKSKFNALLKEHPSITVNQVFMLDDQALNYQKRTVTSWSQYDKMNNQFQKAGQDLTKFMADKKSTQLKLK